MSMIKDSINLRFLICLILPGCIASKWFKRSEKWRKLMMINYVNVAVLYCSLYYYLVSYKKQQ